MDTPSTISRRIAALEDKQGLADDWRRNRLFVPPSGLSDEAWQRWYGDVVAPAKAAGYRVTAVRFVSPIPEPSARSVSLARH